jgi:hypothetical protein
MAHSLAEGTDLCDNLSETMACAYADVQRSLESRCRTFQRLLLLHSYSHLFAMSTSRPRFRIFGGIDG